MRQPLRLQAGRAISDSMVADAVCLVREGWVLSGLNDVDGERRIVGFLLPGDARWAVSGDDPAELIALTRATIDVYPLDALAALASDDGIRGSIMELFWRAQQPLLEQLRLLSGRSGRAKVQALIDGLTRRVRAVPDMADGVVRLPFTRPIVADALGMTERHVSRVLKELEGEGYVSLERGAIRVLDTGA